MFNLDSGSFLQVFSRCIFIVHIYFIILQYHRIVLNVCTILYFLFLCIRLLSSDLDQTGIYFLEEQGKL